MMKAPVLCTWKQSHTHQKKKKKKKQGKEFRSSPSAAHANGPNTSFHHADDGPEALVRSLCKTGQLERAMSILLSSPAFLDSAPSMDTYVCILKACMQNKSLPHAKEVYEHVMCSSRHIGLDGFLGDYMVVTLAKCGGLEDAWNVSRDLVRRTVFSWSAIISAYVDCGRFAEALRLYHEMREERIAPNRYTLVSLVKACGNMHDLVQGKMLHDEARSRGFASDPHLGSTLVSMYGKCGSITDAEAAFWMISKHDVVSWTSMLSAYVEQGACEKALRLYRQMQEEMVAMKDLMYVVTLQACGLLVEKEEAHKIEEKRVKAVVLLELVNALHRDALRNGYGSELIVRNTLVSVYGKCGAISQAEKVFRSMLVRDIISWNAMLSAYVDDRKAEKALQLYRQMQQEGSRPEKLTFVMALQACAILAEKEGMISNGRSTKEIALEIAKALHKDADMNGYTQDMIVGTTLLGVYGRCGEIMEAEDVFDGLLERNLVSWTAMLCAYVEQGKAEKALLLYRHMRNNHEEMHLDSITFLCVLQSSGITGSLELCEELHFSVISAGYDHISTMQATLVNTYGSCASMADAQSAFDGSLLPDVVSWSACISGHASEGNSVESLHMFESFKATGRSPDDILMTSLLSACSYSGLVSRGCEYFETMIRDYAICPNLKHYGILIDLLGRAGDFKRIMNLLNLMPMEADMPIWLSVLGACRMHSSIEMAKHAFDHAVNLQPKQATAYVLMSNIYGDNAGQMTKYAAANAETA